MKIYDVTNLQDGMPVTDLKVRVVGVYDRKTGSGEYGEWSIQNMKVQDESGDIVVTCKNVPDLSHLKEKKIILSATKSDKHGWVGLVAYDNEYKGNIQRNIKMTGACSVELADDTALDAKSQDVEKEVSAPQYTSTEYWNDKFKLDKSRFDHELEKQQIICRQHAVTASLTYHELSKNKPLLNDVIETANLISKWTYAGVKPWDEENIPEPFEEK